MLDTDFSLDGTASYTRLGKVINVLFDKNGSGITLRPKTPIKFDGDYLYIYTNNDNPEVKLNVKFWSKSGTYQAWYVPLTSGQSYLRINLEPVKALGEILIIWIYSDEPIKNLISFQSISTKNKKSQFSGTYKESLIPNGDFEWGMTNWIFWANKGKFKQVTQYDPDSYGRLQYEGSEEGEVFVCTELIDVEPGDYVLRMDLRGQGNIAWKIAWEGESAIYGGFYKDRFSLNGLQSEISTFKVTKYMRCRLYIMWYSPSSLDIRGVRLWKKYEGNRIQVNKKIYVDGVEEFIIGYYAKKDDHFGGLFRHIQLDGIPSKRDLYWAFENNKFLWPEISGAVRARAKNISEINKLWDHPVIGCVYCDEPDHMQTGVSPEEIERVRYGLKGGYPLMTTVMSWNESIMYQYMDSGDILGVELYPVINRKDINWCRNILKKALGMGKPTIAVIEASNLLSEEDQKALLWMPYELGAQGIFIWNEGIHLDFKKLDTFKNNVRQLQNLVR